MTGDHWSLLSSNWGSDEEKRHEVRLNVLPSSRIDWDRPFVRLRHIWSFATTSPNLEIKRARQIVFFLALCTLSLPRGL